MGWSGISYSQLRGGTSPRKLHTSILYIVTRTINCRFEFLFEINDIHIIWVKQTVSRDFCVCVFFCFQWLSTSIAGVPKMFYTGFELIFSQIERRTLRMNWRQFVWTDTVIRCIKLVRWSLCSSPRWFLYIFSLWEYNYYPNYEKKKKKRNRIFITSLKINSARYYENTQT